MFASRNGNIITVSTSLTDAFAGISQGYSVTLHALPKIVFHVDAPNVDKAQALAYAVAKRENTPMLCDSDAATIVKL
jgi:hypothetical protein